MLTGLCCHLSAADCTSSGMVAVNNNTCKRNMQSSIYRLLKQELLHKHTQDYTHLPLRKDMYLMTEGMK